jgi:hypothetical protein
MPPGDWSPVREEAPNNMYVETLGFSAGAAGKVSALPAERELAKLSLRDPSWVLMYAVESAPIEAIMAQLKRTHPKASIFGATSFQGVFAPSGFARGVAMMVAERGDKVDVHPVLRDCDASKASDLAREACGEIERRLEKRPDALLLHATPGFEERILEGVRAAFGTEVPVYGGSAADDDISGKWRIFADGKVSSEGFLLVGIASKKPVRGSFLGGYLPSEASGVVTRAKGRTVYEIDHQPAAVVYNSWTQGAIKDELERGGNILLKTNLLPIARTIGGSQGLPRRLLSHPHEVVGKTRALNFFSEFENGDRILLMRSAAEALITRVRRTVQRARGSSHEKPRGALLIYCGGSLGIVLDQAARISQEMARELGDVPFIGIGTFGEQGCFFEKTESRHGNLMCSAMLF